MMRISKIAWVAAASLLVLAGCAKQQATGANDANERYYNAWVSVQQEVHPEYLWTPFSYGSGGEGYAYLLSETEGEGAEVADSLYIFVEYTAYDLDRNVSSTTSREISHKTGISYDPSYYYGPVVWINSESSITVGMQDLVCGLVDGEDRLGSMKVGGTREAVIPGWLRSSERYSSGEDYLAKITGTNYIYSLKVTDATDDIYRYQIDSIETYMHRHYGEPDSTYTGFYYKRLEENTDESVEELEDNETIYVNYTGRLLNGQVFDTTIADTAKVHNIYNPSKSYEPVKVNWSSDSTAVTLGGSSDIISGFGSLIKRMGNMETAVGIFYSAYGYGTSGSGNLIPAYSPLEFVVSIVPEEEED